MVQTNTSSTKKGRKNSKSKAPKIVYFKPPKEEVTAYAKSDAFSWQQLVITPYATNAVTTGDPFMTLLKGLDMGGEDRFVVGRTAVEARRRESTSARPVVCNKH